jgi:hypothetical protein
MTTTFKAIQPAWNKGALLIIFIVIGDIVARKAGVAGSEKLLFFVWGLFMVAVFVSTYTAPQHKLIVGMSHTLTISLLFALSNRIQSLYGIGVDIGGAKGFGAVFALIYVTSFIPALIAAVAGLIFSARKDKAV